jgi:Raf kinase inhibitor-like YbhB/YbcL family protein
MDRFTLALALVLAVVLATGAIGCGGEDGATPGPSPTPVAAEIEVSSSAFEDGEAIPVVYSCDGSDISVPLSWGDPPAGTGAFALIVDDPDAPGGTFTHWVLFNVPPGARQLEEGIPGQGQLASGALQGKNGFGEVGYGGPCPPAGAPHHYRFTLYALDGPLDLDAGASKARVLDAMQGHVLAEGRLTGTYQG